MNCFLLEVVEKENFGAWVNRTDRKTLNQASSMFLVRSWLIFRDHVQPSWDSCFQPWKVLKKLVLDPAQEPVGLMQTVPNNSLDECWLPLVAFNVDASSKSGCRGLKIVVEVQCWFVSKFSVRTKTSIPKSVDMMIIYCLCVACCSPARLPAEPASHVSLPGIPQERIQCWGGKCSGEISPGWHVPCDPRWWNWYLWRVLQGADYGRNSAHSASLGFLL